MNIEYVKNFLNKQIKFDNKRSPIGFFTCKTVSIRMRINEKGEEIIEYAWLGPNDRYNSIFGIEHCSIIDN